MGNPPPAPGHLHDREHRMVYYLIHPACVTSKLTVSFWNVHLRFSAAVPGRRARWLQFTCQASAAVTGHSRPGPHLSVCGQDSPCSVSMGRVGTQVLRRAGRR